MSEGKLLGMIGKETRERIFTDDFLDDKGTKMNRKWLYMQKGAETQIGNDWQRYRERKDIHRRVWR